MKKMTMLLLTALLMALVMTAAFADGAPRIRLNVFEDQADVQAERQKVLAAVSASLPEATVDYTVREWDKRQYVWNVFFTQGTWLGMCKVAEDTGEVYQVEMFGKPEGAMNAGEVMAALAESMGDITVTELELDWERDWLIYEGEALMNGGLYEFEVSATGDLLEWERD